MRGKLIDLPREVSRGIEKINLYGDMQLNLEKSADTIVGVIIDSTEGVKQTNVLKPIIARFVIIGENNVQTLLKKNELSLILTTLGMM